MPRTLIALVALFSMGATLPLLEGYTKLTGIMRIMPKDFYDPPPGEKNDRVGLYIDGPAAKQIYNAMPANKTRKMDCDPEGPNLQRSAGGLDCLKYKDGSYDCSVAIVLTTGKTDHASVC